VKRKVVIVIALVCLLEDLAWAHRIDEYLQATMLSLETDRAQGSMRLIPGVLVGPSVIALIDSNHDGLFSQDEAKAYAQRVVGDLSITLDGNVARAQLDSWTVPEPSHLRDGLGEISVHYHVDLAPGDNRQRSLLLANRHLNDSSVYLMNVEVPRDLNLQILDQKRNERQSVYEVDYQDLRAAGSSDLRNRFQAWLKGLQFGSLFRLGMRHIEEGTDHLLFLLVLLVPAPLLASGSRWGRSVDVRRSLTKVVGIVTAFTIGHSVTLALAAMNFVHVPSRPVEVLIAASILVSAIHALRPLFPEREAWIAAFFGLIHGLAFASTLERLGLFGWHRLAGIAFFNLGVETMQLLITAAVLPSLLLISRTVLYPTVRIAAGLAAGAASVAWIAERLFNVKTPVDTVVDAVAQHSLWCIGFLFAAGLASTFWERHSTHHFGRNLKPTVFSISFLVISSAALLSADTGKLL
jgi:hypothetical protein